MLLNTPFVSCAAASGTVPPDVIRTAAPTVDWTREPGSTADAVRPRSRDEQAVRPRDAATAQAGLQPLPCPHQPDAERADRTAELTGRRLQGHALEIAEDDRLAVRPRQPLDFLVQDLEVAIVSQVLGCDLVAVSSRRSCVRGPFAARRRTGPGGRRAGRRRAASSRPTSAAGSTAPAWPGPGTWPGRRPGRRGDRPGPCCRRRRPSARAGAPGPRRRARPSSSGRERNRSSSSVSVRPQCVPSVKRMPSDRTTASDRTLIDSTLPPISRLHSIVPRWGVEVFHDFPGSSKKASPPPIPAGDRTPGATRFLPGALTRLGCPARLVANRRSPARGRDPRDP